MWSKFVRDIIFVNVELFKMSDMHFTALSWGDNTITFIYLRVGKMLIHLKVRLAHIDIVYQIYIKLNMY